MDSANVLAAGVESKLGVSGNMAQVFAWLAIFTVGYLALQVLRPLLGGALGKSKVRGQVALILGQCGAGKTALFFRLRDKVEVQSVSSLKPLRDKMQIEELAAGAVEVVDYPGHQRMRGRAAELLPEARCIVYLVDSEDKPRMKDVAEHLYELFTHPQIVDLHIPILLAFNKIDLPTARTEKFIVDEIEREIEIMRNSRGATLEGQDQADSYLGVDGEKFKLLEHSPCPVETCRISVKKPVLDPLYDFMRQQFA